MSKIKATVRNIVGEDAYTKIHDIKFKILGKEEFPKELMLSIQDNKQFENKYAGKRCFILGNGPSLKTVDLSQLADEYVFTVNFFSRIKGAELAKTNFHVLADTAFFEQRDDVVCDPEELAQNYKDIAEAGAPCFAFFTAYEYFKKKGLDEKIDFHYFKGRYLSSDKNHPLEYDITKSISYCLTVVQYAVLIAIYMGFKEIYLLGCDSTNMINYLNALLDVKTEVGGHAYEEKDSTEAAKKWTETKYTSDMLMGEYNYFFTYRRLRELCDAHGIRLVNCSSTTLVNEIPRENLEDVLKRPRP